MAKINSYLSFSNTREAMTFYQDCFGGELYFQTVKESPEMAAQMPPEYADAILHSTLTKDELVIMASDMSRRQYREYGRYVYFGR
jgi:PhnB protein